MSKQTKPTDNELLLLVRTWCQGLECTWDGVDLCQVLSYDLIQLLRRLAGLTV